MAATEQQGIGTARVREPELAAGNIVNSKKHGDEPRIQTSIMQALVQELEHMGRVTGVIDNDLANRADCQRTIERSASAFSGNIAQRHGQAALAVRKKVVKIAAELASGDIRRRQIEARHFAGAGREKLPLNLPGGIE